MKQKTKTTFWFSFWLLLTILGIILFTFKESFISFLTTAIGMFYWGYFSHELAMIEKDERRIEIFKGLKKNETYKS